MQTTMRRSRIQSLLRNASVRDLPRPTKMGPRERKQVIGRQLRRVELMLKSFIHDITKDDIPFMKETRELLDQLLNVCVHDLAKNDLFMDTGEHLEALLNAFLLVHNFAKNDLPFMKETRELLDQLRVHDLAKNDLFMVTGEHLEALLNAFVLVHDFAKNDLPFMKETRELLDQLRVHNLAKNDLFMVTGEHLEALLNAFLLVHNFAKNDLPFMEETAEHLVTGEPFRRVELLKTLEETQSQLREAPALSQSQIVQPRDRRQSLSLLQRLMVQALQDKVPLQNARDQPYAWLQKILTLPRNTKPPRLKYTFKRGTIIVSISSFKISSYFYMNLNNMYYFAWWTLTSASLTVVKVYPTVLVQRSIYRELIKDPPSFHQRYFSSGSDELLLGLDDQFMRHHLRYINDETSNLAINYKIDEILSYVVKAKKETDKMKEYEERYELKVYSEDNLHQDYSVALALAPANPNMNITVTYTPTNTHLSNVLGCAHTHFTVQQNASHPATQPFNIPSNQGSSTTNVLLRHFSPHSWDTEIIRHFSDHTRSNKFIHFLPPELQIQQDAQGGTVCHALGSLRGHLSSAELKYCITELVSCVCLRDCMVCQDSFGNTPLHCIVEAQNSNIDIILDSILKHAPSVAEGLEIRNRDNLTPLDLAFEKKLWGPARVLAEHQIETGTSPTFLQEYFFKAMREQGGIDFLPHLLDLWEHYCPLRNLNFGVDTTGRTPWWYLVHSNDVSVMCRTLQALKDHSVDLTSLQTHTETGTTLVEEAVEKNRVLFMAFRKVAAWGYNDTDQDTDQDTVDQDVLGSSGALSRASSCSTITDPASSDQSESQATQLEPDTKSCNGAIDIQDSSTSDEESDSEPRKAAPQSKGVHRQKRRIYRKS